METAPPNSEVPTSKQYLLQETNTLKDLYVAYTYGPINTIATVSDARNNTPT